MKYRYWAAFALVIFIQASGASQQQHKATVHIIVVDGFGRDLGNATIASFKNLDNGRELANRFKENTARDVPYSVYKVRVQRAAYFPGQITAQVFQPDVWLVVGLRVGEELPEFPAPRLEMSGTINNLDPTEEPVYIRLAGVYSNFIMDAKARVLDHSGTFELAGVIPDGKYILITIGRTGILDVRQVGVKFPAKTPIEIDLAQRGGGSTIRH